MINFTTKIASLKPWFKPWFEKDANYPFLTDFYFLEQSYLLSKQMKLHKFWGTSYVGF